MTTTPTKTLAAISAMCIQDLSEIIARAKPILMRKVATKVIREISAETGVSYADILSEKKSPAQYQARCRVFVELSGKGWSGVDIASIFVRSDGRTMHDSTVSLAIKNHHKTLSQTKPENNK